MKAIRIERLDVPARYEKLLSDIGKCLALLLGGSALTYNIGVLFLIASIFRDSLVFVIGSFRNLLKQAHFLFQIKSSPISSHQLPV